MVEKIKCIDCGVVFESKSHSHNQTRCPECQAIYRREYKAKHIALARVKQKEVGIKPKYYPRKKKPRICIIVSSSSRLYTIYKHMYERCYRRKCKTYKHYGGRGIKMCKEWKENKNAFFEWALANGYDDSLTIDRIDNNRGYSPDNCRWATHKAQANNKRNNIVVTLGKRKLTLSELADETGLSRDLLKYRVKAGWPIDEVINTPINGRGRGQS